MYIDNSLLFLTQASNDDLRTLCDIITKDEDGSFRLTETLSDSQAYHLCYPNNIRGMLPELIHEFRLYGGNTIINFFRGEGPEYSDILRDIAQNFNISYEYADVKNIEKAILYQLFSISIGKASVSELRVILKSLEISPGRFSKKEMISILTEIWESESEAQKLLLSVTVNSIMKGLVGRNVILKSLIAPGLALAMIGPVGWFFLPFWKMVDLVGPAYRVIVPTVIFIAYLRQKLNIKTLITQ